MIYQNAADFLNNNPDIPLIDVRSPAEFNKGHITGAVSIPLFSDEQRREIGILYKNRGRIEAIKKGLDFVGPQMQSLAQKAVDLSNETTTRKVYCWRGGMRSEKMAWLFELVGCNCFVLKNGYKSYRNKLIQDFENIEKILILHGPTGSGKTEILNELKSMGEQVIDLEDLANHKGSAFGHIGQKEQPTSQQFHNDIHNQLLNMDLKKPIWVESESLRVGSVNLPDQFWQKMKQGILISLDITRELRIKKIVSEYGIYPIEQLRNSILNISEKLGGKRTKEAIELLEESQLELVTDILLDYYDRTYSFTRSKNHKKIHLSIVSDTINARENALKLKDAFYETEQQQIY